MFQSPSLRGSGRFQCSHHSRHSHHGVSIPFIAGQWSLRDIAVRALGVYQLCFNPLHCGAVVASRSVRSGKRRHRRKFQSPSLRGSGRFRVSPDKRKKEECFNPLHCGAVVASIRHGSTGWRRSACFNPLHCGAVVASGCYRWNKRKALPPFQSPSLRGSGRFHLLPTRSTNGLCWFQSPSLRGSGRFKLSKQISKVVV